ncbi:MAG: efflux RND transporter periplasmic adaptor subunit [Candidatus Omnitrophica bacterium]|nr:efflux RND transporter periplasmic adaptor subunit [Candidatus Omnitrophota bacterium]
MMKSSRIILVLAAICCLLVGLTGCGRKAAERVIKIPVSAVTVKLGDFKDTLFYVGDIKGEDEAMVYPKVTGKVIEELVKEGDKVKKGDALVNIDRDEVGFQFEKAPVESPIDGIVGRLYIDRGTAVSTQTPIAFIADMDTVKIEVNVAERDLPKIKEGQSSAIKVDAYPGEVFEGVVDRVSPVVDLTSRTALIEVKIPNDDHRLRPGMFGRITILIIEKENALIVPRDAIVKEDSSNYVFVVGDGNRVNMRKVELGLSEDNKLEVIDGLNEGELVVTMGNVRLKDGDVAEVVDTYYKDDYKEDKER